jgi:hypothetical protein
MVSMKMGDPPTHMVIPSHTRRGTATFAYQEDSMQVPSQLRQATDSPSFHKCCPAHRRGAQINNSETV